MPAFLRFRIPIAPLSEQKRIVDEIDKQFTRLDAGLAALRRVQANLKRYRAAILNSACAGNLVPNDAELAQTSSRIFESGSELLRKILAERRERFSGRGHYKEPVEPSPGAKGELPSGWTLATIEQVTSMVATGATPP